MSIAARIDLLFGSSACACVLARVSLAQWNYLTQIMISNNFVNQSMRSTGLVYVHVRYTVCFRFGKSACYKKYVQIVWIK